MEWPGITTRMSMMGLASMPGMAVLPIWFRGCLIMLVNDRAEIFQTDLFLWRRSIAGYATEAKG